MMGIFGPMLASKLKQHFGERAIRASGELGVASCAHGVDAFLQAVEFSHSKMVAHFAPRDRHANARKPLCGFR